MKTIKEQKQIINKFGEISKFLTNDICFTGEDDKGNKRYHLWKLLCLENILKYKKQIMMNYG